MLLILLHLKATGVGLIITSLVTSHTQVIFFTRPFRKLDSLNLFFIPLL